VASLADFGPESWHRLSYGGSTYRVPVKLVDTARQAAALG
jgi:ribosomal protein S7